MVASLVKTIKPKRLKVGATRLRILNALRSEGNDIAKEYRKTVATWKDKPKFEVLIGLTGRDATVVVGPTGNDDAVKHFVWTDKGTKPHVIRAKNYPRLLYAKTVVAKTAPRVIGSRQGSASGPYGGPESVNHPGTEARLFTVTIMSATRKKRIVKRLIEAARVEAK